MRVILAVLGCTLTHDKIVFTTNLVEPQWRVSLRLSCAKSLDVIKRTGQVGAYCISPQYSMDDTPLHKSSDYLHGTFTGDEALAGAGPPVNCSREPKSSHQYSQNSGACPRQQDLDGRRSPT